MAVSISAGLIKNVSLTALREAPRSFYISFSEDKTREREMQPQGELIQTPDYKIQFCGLEKNG